LRHEPTASAAEPVGDIRFRQVKIQLRPSNELTARFLLRAFCYQDSRVNKLAGC
jgi:hypothetical protein